MECNRLGAMAVVVGDDDHASANFAAVAIDILQRTIGIVLSLRRRLCAVNVCLLLVTVAIEVVNASVPVIVDDGNDR